jgi:eukaryotic-like serine/threonine-protein kinase
MGDVYRARDEQLGRIVAIKVLADRYADDESIRERFKREALAAARLSGSPNIVTIFDVGDSDGHPYIVMELLEGGTLEDRIKAGGAQDASDVLRWLDQAALALDAAHAAGVVHRDVKPGNLLLNGRGEVSVGDFGVASAVGLDSMTMTGTVLGTAGYLSPEQASGERATPASDRYGLGVVAYELLTGRRPFESDSATAEAAAHVHAPIPYPSEHSDLPPELDPVLRRALAKDPEQRFASSADFVAALREALSHAAGTTRALAAVREDEYATAVPPTATRRQGPSPLVWAGAAILGLLALGAGLGAAGILGGDEEPQTRTVVQTQVTTQQGQPTTVRETVTTTPATTTQPTTRATTQATTATTAPSDQGGVELTDQATALLNQGRWAEAEAVSRQALAQLEGTGELYEAYANYNLGRALVEQGRCEEALPHLDRSEAIQGSRREIREARARCS